MVDCGIENEDKLRQLAVYWGCESFDVVDQSPPVAQVDEEFMCQGDLQKVDVVDPGTEIPDQLYCSIEAMSGRKHMRATKVGRDTMVLHKTTVPPDHVFLVSDNRVYPLDSRSYGAVPRASCKEMVFFRVVGSKGWGDVESRLSSIQ